MSVAATQLSPLTYGDMPIVSESRPVYIEFEAFFSIPVHSIDCSTLPTLWDVALQKKTLVLSALLYFEKGFLELGASCDNKEVQMPRLVF